MGLVADTPRCRGSQLAPNRKLAPVGANDITRHSASTTGVIRPVINNHLEEKS